MGFDDTGLGAAMAQSHSDSRVDHLEKMVAMLQANIRELKGYIVRHRQRIGGLQDEVNELRSEIIARSNGTPFDRA